MTVAEAFDMVAKLVRERASTYRCNGDQASAVTADALEDVAQVFEAVRDRAAISDGIFWHPRPEGPVAPGNQTTSAPRDALEASRRIQTIEVKR